MTKRYNLPARRFLAMLVVFLTIVASLAPLFHHHAAGERSDRCPECLALAIASTAIATVGWLGLEKPALLQRAIEVTYDFETSSVPLVILCRGPPASTVA